MTAAARFTLADAKRLAQAQQDLDRLRASMADFAASMEARTGVADFLDIPSGGLFDVKPEQALAYFRAKGLRPTFSYADMMGQAHDQAFTVAKMLDVDMLAHVRDSLDKAMAKGESFKAWAAKLTPTLQAAGWWGEQDLVDPDTGATVRSQLGSPWRLETIFRTNMQNAYSVQAWQEIQAQAELAPFLLYDAVDDMRTRDAHKAWDGRVLPVGHEWWASHYPPNGWNCRCGVIQLDADQLQELGLTPSEPPDEGTYNWRNPRTGDMVEVPVGIDPGFGRNAGQDYLGSLQRTLLEKVQALPPSMRQAVKPALPAPPPPAPVRREFDKKTAAGRWHAASFDDAPDWVRNAVLASPEVKVQHRSRTDAWARRDVLVEMDGGKANVAADQSTWRHEFGHVVDARLGARTVPENRREFMRTSDYRSSAADFTGAMERTAAKWVKVDDDWAANNAAIANAANAVRQVGGDAREAVLRDMATRAGVNFDDFRALVRGSTLIDPDSGVGASVRMAKMLAALERNDAQAFVRYASFKDVHEQAKRDMDLPGIRDAQNTLSNSWRKDGSLAKLSDLIGAATKNRLASYEQGFCGHSTGYYSRPGYQQTEVFANLLGLAGHPNPTWWRIVKLMAPDLAALFERIIREEVKP